MNLKSVILAWDNNLRPNEFTTKQKLDGVGPIDNRPSTDKLQRFVREKKKKKKLWHVKCHTLHVTYDMWHMTRDI